MRLSLDRGDWSRTRRALGAQALKRLETASVAVVGLGGVGGYAVEALARAPVGRLFLVDPDVVEPSNFNRQICAVLPALGRPKAVVLAERVRMIRPETDVFPLVTRVSERTVEDVLGAHQLDCVVDAIDSVADKVALLAWCVQRRLPVVSSMGAGRRVDPTRVRVAELLETRGCPLAREVRRRLRRYGYEGGVRAVFSEEPPVSSASSATRAERVIPSVSWTPGAFGLACAAEAVRLILAGQTEASRSGRGPS